MVDFMTKERVIADWVVFPRFLMDYSIGFTAKWTYTLLYNELLNRGAPTGTDAILCRRPLPSWQRCFTRANPASSGPCRNWRVPDL